MDVIRSMIRHCKLVSAVAKHHLKLKPTAELKLLPCHKILNIFNLTKNGGLMMLKIIQVITARIAMSE